MSESVVHPQEVLLGAQAGAVVLPVCDHYSGVEARMRKSLALQAEMAQEFGACVFDVTLDCEDGAPVACGCIRLTIRPSPATWSPSRGVPAIA
jgi:citrate lyase subunit beta/citryl-CoA lyase